MPHTSRIPIAALLAFTALTLPAALAASAQKVTTSQYGNLRQGVNLIETTLTPANVNPQHFGKLFTLPVDGDVYAQPLFLSAVQIPGHGRHDVLYIATEHDSVYAFDAYKPGPPLWHVNLIPAGATTVPYSDTDCPFIRPEVGITSTPVIDEPTGTLYVLTRSKTRANPLQSTFRQTLHALAITNGVEKFSGPVDIHATVPGSGGGSSFGTLAFDPKLENPRAALTLAQGQVILTWGSSCDVTPYHGWIISYDAHTLHQRAVFNASPNSNESGFWASDTGPAVDPHGNLIIATGNGRFNADNHSYGDSLLKLSPSLKLLDYFTPAEAEKLDRTDGDLGSGGPLLFPAQPGPHPNLAMIAGKSGTLFLVNLDHMGQYQPTSNNSQAVQTIPNKGGVYASEAFWRHTLYVLSDSDQNAIQTFDLTNGHLTPKAASGSTFAAICATPTLSANANKDGILWVLRSKTWNGPDNFAELTAFDAGNINHRLYSSEQNPTRDRAGTALRFNIPIVINGHVYLGAKHEVDIYGLLPTSK